MKSKTNYVKNLKEPKPKGTAFRFVKQSLKRGLRRMKRSYLNWTVVCLVFSVASVTLPKEALCQEETRTARYVIYTDQLPSVSVSGNDSIALLPMETIHVIQLREQLADSLIRYVAVQDSALTKNVNLKYSYQILYEQEKEKTVSFSNDNSMLRQKVRDVTTKYHTQETRANIAEGELKTANTEKWIWRGLGIVAAIVLITK